MNKIFWRVTYISNSCDSSMPRRTMEFYAGYDYAGHDHDAGNSILVAARTAHTLVKATVADGAKIIKLERI